MVVDAQKSSVHFPVQFIWLISLNFGRGDFHFHGIWFYEVHYFFLKKKSVSVKTFLVGNGSIVGWYRDMLVEILSKNSTDWCSCSYLMRDADLHLNWFE